MKALRGAGFVNYNTSGAWQGEVRREMWRPGPFRGRASPPQALRCKPILKPFLHSYLLPGHTPRFRLSPSPR